MGQAEHCRTSRCRGKSKSTTSVCAKMRHSLEGALQADPLLEIIGSSETASEPHLVESSHITIALDDPR